ncbi:MAG: hypothetical protein H0U03_08245 [Actinobacteria bacterium]|nr:hypothetical protein [Actinomycetota bacterium]
MLLAALRRLGFVLCLAGGLTAAFSALVGLLAGASLTRAVSLGFYLVGSFLLVSGFFIGNRGPARVKSESGTAGPFGMFLGSRTVRWATAAEQEDSINLSAVFVTVGLALVVLGAAVDSRYKLA